MKIFLCCIFPVLFGFAGFMLSGKYSDRKNFFESLSAFHKLFKTEMAFTAKTVSEIAEKLDKNTDFYRFFNGYFADKNFSAPKYLTEEEKEFMGSYFDNIGLSDKKTQLEYCNSLDDRIENFVKNAREENKKYQPLYVKLGVLFGLIVFILLI